MAFWALLRFPQHALREPHRDLNTISGGLSESDAQSIFGSTSGTLTIDGDGDDSVELLDGGEWSTTGAISGGYITYTSDSGFTLQIDADINVSYVI